jgi:hypothetical protein
MKTLPWVLVAALGCSQSKDEAGTKKPEPAPAKDGTPLPTGRVAATTLVGDGLYLYWADAGKVVRADRDGKAMALIARDDGLSGRLTLDATHVYWMTQNGFARVSKQGGSLEVVGQYMLQPGSIAATGGKLYFTVPKEGKIMVAAPGSPPSEVVAGEKNPGEIAVDKDFVYWSADGAVRKRSLFGGEATTLAEGQADLAALCLDDANVYWTMRDSIAGVAKDGKAAKVLAKGTGAATACASDGKQVYFAGARSVWSVPPSGGEPVEIARTKGAIGRLVVDETALYWNDYSGGRIMKLVREPGK